MNSLQNSEFLPIEGRFPCKGGACRERAGDNQRESPLAKNAAPQRRSFAQAVLPRGSKPFACGRAQINRHTPPGLLGEPEAAQRTWDRPANPGSPDKSRIVRRSSPNEPGARRFQQAEQGPSATAPVPRGRTRRPYHGTRTPYPHLRLRSTPICVSTFSRAPNRAVSTCRRPNRLGTIRMRPPDGPASARARSAEASHGNRRSPFRPQLHRPR